MAGTQISDTAVFLPNRHSMYDPKTEYTMMYKIQFLYTKGDDLYDVLSRNQDIRDDLIILSPYTGFIHVARWQGQFE